MEVTRRTVLKGFAVGATEDPVGGAPLPRAKKCRLGDPGAADSDWVESRLLFPNGLSTPPGTEF